MRIIANITTIHCSGDSEVSKCQAMRPGIVQGLAIPVFGVPADSVYTSANLALRERDVGCTSRGLLVDIASTLPILLSWAVHLSGYAQPAEPPSISFEPHSFFVERVCGGRECKAVGWYNDEDVIYIDAKYRNDDSRFVASLIVHELVHHLQHLSGRFDSHSCEDSLMREREAYHIQNEYILQAHASFALIRPGPTSCNYQASSARHLS